jgi:hypothetical protein
VNDVIFENIQRLASNKTNRLKSQEKKLTKLVVNMITTNDFHVRTHHD